MTATRLTPAELAAVKPGDWLVVQAGARRFFVVVEKVTAKLIYTTGRTFFRETGGAKQFSLVPQFVAGVKQPGQTAP